MLDIQNGADHKAVETDHGFPVIGSGGPFAFASTPMFDGESVLLGRKGTIDKPLYVRGPFWTVDTMYWSKIEEGTSARFAYYVATTIPFGYYSTNTALPSMTKSLLNAHLVPLPHLSEQQVIAAFLDRETAKIDALIAEQEKLIALLAEKRQATIAHAVTRGLEPDVPMKDSGAPCIGEVPAHWEVAPLKRFWSVTDCKHLTAEFVDDGYPLASIREVQSRYVALEEAKRTTEHFYAQLIEGDRKPMPGDLIFSRNATVGEVSQVTEEHPAFAMGQDVCLLRRLDASASPDYLQDVIRSGVVVEQLKNIMVGSTFKRVNVEEIRCLAVPMPPTGEQRRIAEFLKAERMRFEAIEQHAGRSISLLRERRSALITAAVTGQIDVRGTAQHDRTTPESIAA
jgi:type I restriction enzyme S subunit